MYAAFNEVVGRFPDCRLLLVGDFEEGDPVARDLVDALQAQPNVIITGFVDDGEIPVYCGLMSLLVLPSFREGFPNSVLEAAASSLPVVGFRVTGVVDAVEDGVTGTLVEPGDTAALADAVAGYLASPELVRSHGHAGRERAERLFRRDVIWSGLLELYRELLDQGGAS